MKTTKSTFLISLSIFILTTSCSSDVGRYKKDNGFLLDSKTGRIWDQKQDKNLNIYFIEVTPEELK